MYSWKCLHTVYFCEFFDLSKAFRTLKDHFKSEGGRCTNGPGERLHAFQKSHESKSTVSLLKLLSRQDLVTKSEVFEKVV